MATASIKPGQLAALLKSQIRTNKTAVKFGMKLGAERGKADLVRATPAFSGLMRQSWQVIEQGDDIILENTSPIAGIIERGARPHGVNAEGVAAIKRWIYLKIGLDTDSSDFEEQDEANAILWGYIKRLKLHGEKGHFIVEKALPQLAAYLNQEIAIALAKALTKP